MIRTLLCLAALFVSSGLVAEESDPASEAVAAYAAAWGESDATKRMALLERAWADDGVYTDPTAEVRGREALDQHIAAFQAQGTGARILQTTVVDSHHGMRLRFGWKMVSDDGTTMVEGIDYGELDEDGRLRLIVGFFGEMKPLE